MAKSEATWTEIDPRTLDDGLEKAFDAYKASYRQTKALREAFEAAMREQAALPEGQRLVFGYNFGKLSVAVVEDTSKPKAPAKPKLSLGEYLAQQRAMGRE